MPINQKKHHVGRAPDEEDGPEARSMALVSFETASSTTSRMNALPRIASRVKPSNIISKTSATIHQKVETDTSSAADWKWQIGPNGLAPFPGSDETNSLCTSWTPARTLVLPLKGNDETKTAQEALELISNFMRSHSIEGSFDARTNCIHGRSMECGNLHFVIQLWKSTNGNNAGADGCSSGALVLEFQRRRGCGVGAQCIRRAIFTAIQRADVIPCCTQPTNASIWQKLYPTGMMKCPVSMLKKQHGRSRAMMTSRQCSEQALAVCYGLLVGPDDHQQPQHTSIYEQNHRLGLEQLLYLTKPTGSALQEDDDEHSGTIIARAVVWKQGPHVHWIRPLLARYFAQHEPPESCYSTVAVEMGQMALHIVANSLVTATSMLEQEQRCGPTTSSDVSDEGGFGDEFWHVCAAYWRDSLCQHVAVGRPDTAAVSAKCIRLLKDLSRRHACVADWELDDVFVSDLLRAHAYGQVHHSDLAAQCRELIRHCLGQDLL